MASAAGDPLASAKDLCVDILDCCAQIQTVLLKLKESLRRKDAAVWLQAAVRGFLVRQRARLLRGTKRTNYLSPAVGGGGAAPSNRHVSGLLGAAGHRSAQGQHRRRTRACGAAGHLLGAAGHHFAQGGYHGWSHSDNHPHGASSRRFAPR